MSEKMTQVKFTIESGIVSAFKIRCANEKISMASVIRRWMKDCHPARTVKTNTLTRPSRRKSVREIIVLLNGIMDSESAYRDSIPEQFTQRHEDSDCSCEALMEAISCLEEAY